jgi:hypothetical protein
MFPYRNSVKKYRGQLISVFFCVPAIPVDDALSLPESESKMVDMTSPTNCPSSPLCKTFQTDSLQRRAATTANRQATHRLKVAANQLERHQSTSRTSSKKETMAFSIREVATTCPSSPLCKHCFPTLAKLEDPRRDGY